MPLRDFECVLCGAVQERYYQSMEKLPPCSVCHGPLNPGELSTSFAKTGVFPYTTTHLTGDGKPVTIESLGHLRSLERQYGVVVHAFSNEPSNQSTPRDLPRHRPNGREYEPTPTRRIR